MPYAVCGLALAPDLASFINIDELAFVPWVEAEDIFNNPLVTPFPVQVFPSAPADVVDDTFNNPPVVSALPATLITVPVAVASSTCTPLFVCAPVKLNRANPFAAAAADADVKENKALVLVVLLELSVTSFVKFATPASFTFNSVPVLPAFEAPLILMFAKFPVKVVSAEVEVTFSSDPTFAPAVVIPALLLAI